MCDSPTIPIQQAIYYFNQGYSFARERDIDRAQEYLQQAAELFRQHPQEAEKQAAYQLSLLEARFAEKIDGAPGNLRLDQGKYQEAIDWYLSYGTKTGEVALMKLGIALVLLARSGVEYPDLESLPEKAGVITESDTTEDLGLDIIEIADDASPSQEGHEFALSLREEDYLVIDDSGKGPRWALFQLCLHRTRHPERSPTKR